MKKIFSLSLMAVALLISGNAKAVTVTTEAQLVAAVANGGDIVLGQDIVLDKTLQIAQSYSTPGKVINLNLNGKTLSNNPAQNISVIELFKGTLNISNGTIKGQYPTDKDKCKDAIIVHGVYQDQQNWSNLNVKKDAKVISDKNAITVLEFWGKGIDNYYSGFADAVHFQKYYTNINSDGAIEMFNGSVWNGPSMTQPICNELGAYYFYAYTDQTFRPRVDPGLDSILWHSIDTVASNAYDKSINGTKKNNKWGWKKLTSTNQPDLSKYPLGFNRVTVVKKEMSSGVERPDVVDYTSSIPYATYAEWTQNGVNTKKDDQKVVIDTTSYTYYYNTYKIAGAYAKANGVNITVDGYVYGDKYGIKVNGTLKHASTYMPNIIVSETAEVACRPDDASDEKDGTAIYCSGMANYTIKGYVHGNIAVAVKAGEVLIEDAILEGTGSNYTEVTTGGSGMNGGSGCGLIVDTQKGYGGKQNVTVAGDTKISANSGFAVQEVIVTENGQDVDHINIEGGTIVAGDKGAMNFTQETAGENKVTIYGANVQGQTTIGQEELDRLEDLKGEDTFVTEMIIDGEVTLVVSKGTQPSATEYSFLDATIPASAIMKEETVTLTKDLTLGHIQMPNETKVTIPAGLTLTIDQLLMGDDAQFIIMPGAKLVVKGEQGILAGKTSNLVIKADETGMGTFIFNPAVTSNRNPMATVEFYAKTYDVWGDRSEYRYEIMVSPFKTISALNAKTSDGKMGEYYWSYQYWNGNAWVVANKNTIINVAQAFQPIALGNSTPSDVSTIYTFQGQLQGNVSGEFNLERGYNYMGNGYVASMDATKIIEEAVKSGKVEPSIWIWDFETQNYVSYTLDKLSEMPNMNALNFFILKATGDAKVDLNYEKLVWDFNNK